MKAMLVCVLGLLCAILSRCQAEGGKSSQGLGFVVAFMENRVLVNYPVIRLYVTSATSQPITVDISVPLMTEQYGSEHVVLQPGDVYMKEFSHDLHMLGSGYESKGISIEASGDITVQGASINDLSTDAFLALPTHVLGLDYYVMCYLYTLESAHAQGPTEFAVIGVHDDTEVIITLPDEVDDVTVGQDTVYGIRVILDRCETFQIQSQYDLTGSRVQSSKVVSVFSGAVWTSVSHQYMGDHLTEHLPPVETWGSEFFTSPVANRTSGDVFRVVAQGNDTWIRVFNSDGSQWTVAGIQQAEYADFEASSTEGLHVVANKAVLLVQLCKSHYADGNRFSDPFMAIVPPVKQYSNFYAFSTISSLVVGEDGEGDFTHYLNVIVETSHIAGILLDDLPLESYVLELDWEELIRNFTAFHQPDYSMSTVRLDVGVHLIRHTDPGVRFMCMLYGLKLQESYAHPLGQNIVVVPHACSHAFMLIDDHFDNDCDNRFDEELEDGIDNDGDGLIDEDIRRNASDEMTTFSTEYSTTEDVTTMAVFDAGDWRSESAGKRTKPSTTPRGDVNPGDDGKYPSDGNSGNNILVTTSPSPTTTSTAERGHTSGLGQSPKGATIQTVTTTSPSGRSLSTTQEKTRPHSPAEGQSGVIHTTPRVGSANTDKQHTTVTLPPGKSTSHSRTASSTRGLADTKEQTTTQSTTGTDTDKVGGHTTVLHMPIGPATHPAATTKSSSVGSFSGAVTKGGGVTNPRGSTITTTTSATATAPTTNTSSRQRTTVTTTVRGEADPLLPTTKSQGPRTRYPASSTPSEGTHTTTSTRKPSISTTTKTSRDHQDRPNQHSTTSASPQPVSKGTVTDICNGQQCPKATSGSDPQGNNYPRPGTSLTPSVQGSTTHSKGDSVNGGVGNDERKDDAADAGYPDGDKIWDEERGSGEVDGSGDEERRDGPASDDGGGEILGAASTLPLQGSSSEDSDADSTSQTDAPDASSPKDPAKSKSTDEDGDDDGQLLLLITVPAVVGTLTLACVLWCIYCCILPWLKARRGKPSVRVSPLGSEARVSPVGGEYPPRPATCKSAGGDVDAVADQSFHEPGGGKTPENADAKELPSDEQRNDDNFSDQDINETLTESTQETPSAPTEGNTEQRPEGQHVPTQPQKSPSKVKNAEEVHVRAKPVLPALANIKSDLIPKTRRHSPGSPSGGRWTPKKSKVAPAADESEDRKELQGYNDVIVHLPHSTSQRMKLYRY